MNGKEEQDDFMDVMLNVLQGTEISGYDSDTIIKATCLVSKMFGYLFFHGFYLLLQLMESKRNPRLCAINYII